jgi:membrane protein
VRLPGVEMSWKEFFQGMKNELSKDAVTDGAASITYYSALALFPFLLFVVALASLFLQPSDAEKLVAQLRQVAPGPATQIVGDRVRELAQSQHGSLVGFGALGAIWAASGGAMALMRALNTCYDVDEGRPFWKVRAIAVLMTVLSGVLALAAGLVAVAAGPIGDAIGGPLGTAVSWLRLPVAAIVMLFLWAVVYYVLPDVEQTFKFITPGSVLGVVLWLVASWGFSKYVANFGNYDKTYGALGGVIVMLLWMWISSLVLLLGAEVNAFIEHRSPEGKREGAKRRSDRGMSPRATVAGKEPVPVASAPREAKPEATDTSPTSLQGAAIAASGRDNARERAAARGERAGSPAPARALAREREERPRLGAILALATGFAAGIFAARRAI